MMAIRGLFPTIPVTAMPRPGDGAGAGWPIRPGGAVNPGGRGSPRAEGGEPGGEEAVTGPPGDGGTTSGTKGSGRPTAPAAGPPGVRGTGSPGAEAVGPAGEGCGARPAGTAEQAGPAVRVPRWRGRE